MAEYRVSATPAPYRKPRRPRLESPRAVLKHCQPLISRKQEEVWVLLLDSQHYLMRKVMVAKGALNAAHVTAREVFRPAVLAAAAAVILVHNHPSGDPTPSVDDRVFTRAMAEAGELLGVSLLDHVIVAKGGYASLREHGVL